LVGVNVSDRIDTVTPHESADDAEIVLVQV